MDLHKRQLSPDFHLNLHGQSITMWSTLIIEPSNHIHSSATTNEPDTIHPTPLSCAFQVINELFRDDPPSHAHTSKIYQHRKTSTDLQQIQSRRDDVLIAWLRSGHHLSLKAHHHCIDPEIDYVSIISASRTHTTTLVSWMPSGRCYLVTCAWQPPRLTEVASRPLLPHDLETW